MIVDVDVAAPVIVAALGNGNDTVGVTDAVVDLATVPEGIVLHLDDVSPVDQAQHPMRCCRVALNDQVET